LFDSLAAGVPVVQVTQGWIKELLEEEECGITVPPDDPSALAAAVERLRADPALSLRLGRNAQHVARTRFDRVVLAREMAAVLERASTRERRA
jgi:glycosyltransferase involved in cell wall biosynthesis